MNLIKMAKTQKEYYLNKKRKFFPKIFRNINK